MSRLAEGSSYAPRGGVVEGAAPVIDRLVALAGALRRAGIDVSTGDVVDAGRALSVLDVSDREVVRIGLRAVLIKHEPDLAVFDRAFDLVFGDAPDRGAGVDMAASVTPHALAGAVSSAATAGDVDAMRSLAARAVAMFGDDDTSDGAVTYRVLRALDVATMLSAAMGRLRDEGEMSEFELALRRHEIARALEAFRRALAEELARFRDRHGRAVAADVPPSLGMAETPLLALSSGELHDLRRTLQPLTRQLAARVGRRRRPTATGRVDVRRTMRRSLQSGGIPIDPVLRRRHPHRPDVVVLCDVSGSVAEFAQFTFTLVHALHDVLDGVRSFAFVGGIAEMTDVFAEAVHDVPVRMLLERRGVVGLDGHSDYGAVFRQFADEFLDAAVGRRTTIIVTGDGRSNFRDPGNEAFRAITDRARRVYWLDPEPRGDWFVDDSAMADYARLCDGVFEVSTVRALADVIADLV